MLLRSTAPTIFESFNARSLLPTQVAARFVPPAQYSDLIKRRHSVIIGPRGSGKTTLLKMLQQPALEAWRHPDADAYCRRIDFTAVFVAADITWSEQLEALGGRRLDRESRAILTQSAFTTHLLRAVVTAFSNRINPEPEAVRGIRRVEMTDAQEAKLVRAVARIWLIKPEIPSLMSLKHALSGRMQLIAHTAQQEALREPATRIQRLAEMDEFHVPFLQAVSGALEMFDDIVGEPFGKWVLAFDELELAPRFITRELMRAMRSTDERLLFKLAVSPIGEEASQLDGPFAAAPDHDFDPIPLWYAERRHAIPFCEDLWSAMLKDRGLPYKDARDVLGRSYFETPQSEWAEKRTAYRAKSRLGKRILRLYQNDRTFRRYLQRKRIDPEKLGDVSSDRRASDLRKISPLIPIREFYRTPDRLRGEPREQLVRSRKLPTVYAGAEALFAITEGNPRWFIGIFDVLLDKWRTPKRRISPNVQAREIERAAKRFEALLKNLAVPIVPRLDGQQGLHSLIETIGNYFHEQVVVRDFIPEPVATFKVDDNVAEDIVAVLGEALNAGAIVHVPDKSSKLFLSTLRDNRFRVSYLLAPQVGIPLRLGKPVNLSTILGDRVKVITPMNLTLPL